MHIARITLPAATAPATKRCLRCRDRFVTATPRRQHLCAPCGDANARLTEDYAIISLPALRCDADSI